MSDGKPLPPLVSGKLLVAKDARKHENRIASALGGRRRPRSGGKARSVWDSRTEGRDLDSSKELQLCVEHKHAKLNTGSIGVTRAWLEKVTSPTKGTPMYPALCLTFEGMQPYQDWILVPLAYLERRLGERLLER